MLAEKLRAASDACAVGPVQTRGILRATGKDAKDYLHRMSTQDLNRLPPGESAYAAFLSAKGHLLAEGHVLAQEDGLLLDADPRALPDARVHLERLVIMDDVASRTSRRRCAIVPVLGPEAALRLEGYAPAAPRIAHERRGAPGIDVLLPPHEAEALRVELVAEGAVALDDADLDALRILAGVPRFGADVDASRLPMEAGLTRAGNLVLEGLLHRPGGRPPRDRSRPPPARPRAARPARGRGPRHEAHRRGPGGRAS